MPGHDCCPLLAVWGHIFESRYRLTHRQRDERQYVWAAALGPVGDHALCAVVNDLRIRERVARPPDGYRPLATCENRHRDLLWVKWLTDHPVKLSSRVDVTPHA